MSERSKAVGHTRKIRVWNDGAKDIVDAYINDTAYNIPAGRCITVGRREAIDLRSHIPGKDPRTGHLLEWNLTFETVPESGTSLKSDGKSICPVCGEAFLESQKQMFMAHLKQHATQALEPDAKAPTVAGKYVCPFCGEFGSDSAPGLKRHMNACAAAKETREEVAQAAVA